MTNLFARPWYKICGLGLMVSGLTAGCGAVAPNDTGAVTQTQVAAGDVDPTRELVITDLSVVEDGLRTTYVAPTKRKKGDSAGKWTFGRLMENLAPGANTSDFVSAWLATWEHDVAVNGYVSAARPDIRSVLTDPWRIASGCAPGADACTLDLSRAPFRLLAITNRIDLRQTQDDETGNAGEGRFVFGALDPSGAPLKFTVIFEFELPAKKYNDISDWAKAWHQLGTLPFGPSYNAALEKITDGFSGPNVAKKSVNGSALHQVRTNEVALVTTRIWELREFHLSAETGQLAQTTVKQTPDLSVNGAVALSAFLQSNATNVLSGDYETPPAMLGASAITPFSLLWTAPNVPEDVRHAFAQNTCNGCHLKETSTTFLHVTGRAAGAPTTLSNWLTTVEFPRRATDLASLLQKVTPADFVQDKAKNPKRAAQTD